MLRAEFRATVRGGYQLAGVEQTGRIERQLHVAESLQLLGLELRAHLVDFLDADPVFTGDGAAHFHAQFQYLAADFFGAMQFVRLARVVQNQRMQVAVAGMEHIADAQTVFERQLPDAAQYTREFAPRDGAVHAVVIGRDAARRGEGGLAPGP